MIRRPWPIVFSAAYFLLFPLIYLFLSYITDGTHGFSLWEKSTWTLFLALPPIVGIAIYSMRAWGYPIILGYLLGSIVDAVLRIYENGTMGLHLGFVLLTTFTNILIVSYFINKTVREIYFNPRIRWWESQPRYFVEIPAELIVGKTQIPCAVCDISKSGVFILTRSNLNIDEEVGISFSYKKNSINKLTGKIIYKRSDYNTGVGIFFEKISKENQASIKAILEILKTQNVKNRNTAPNWWEDFKIGMHEVANEVFGAPPLTDEQLLLLTEKDIVESTKATERDAAKKDKKKAG